ncbi:MAG: TIGR03936 family radical SAM-associated protein [Thermoleophilia bacterium]|nr:TIGR03936 family radical SAM-associated protein [Thermoleophilia bacterium]
MTTTTTTPAATADTATDKRITSPERAAAESAAAFKDRYHYRISISIQGRIRFLSHLETVDTLLGALRRAGVTLALSEGMRPKPRIKMAMPRPVATEAWNDIFEVELADVIDEDQFALQLSEVLPAGLLLQRVERLHGAYVSAASRVAGATWRWNFGPDVPVDALERAVEQLLAAPEVLVERASPKKQARSVDVRRFIGEMTVHQTDEGSFVRAFVRLTEAGSAKPEEVVRALGALAERELAPQRTVRESIAIAEPGEGGRVAEPELVGADVPDGPAKPWGAC